MACAGVDALGACWARGPNRSCHSGASFSPPVSTHERRTRAAMASSSAMVTVAAARAFCQVADASARASRATATPVARGPRVGRAARRSTRVRVAEGMA